MNEYLLIENFGPIDEIILDDIRPFTVFIGESGSGKSTIMKVLSLFRWMYKRVNLRSYLQHVESAGLVLDSKKWHFCNGIADGGKRRRIL